MITETTPLTLAEAGRVGADPVAPDGFVNTHQSSWFRVGRAAALAAVLAVGAVAAIVSGSGVPGVVLARAPLGEGRNRVHRVDEVGGVPEERSSETRVELRAHSVPRLGELLEERTEAAEEKPMVTKTDDIGDEAAVEIDDDVSAAAIAETADLGALRTESAEDVSSVSVTATEKASNLGQASRYCANAFSAPKKVGSVDESRISLTMHGILKYADSIYVLCTDMCDSLVVPTELADRVTMVDGYKVDECGGYGEAPHWEKASRAHRAAMFDAFRDSNTNVVGILEQDTEGDSEVTWQQNDWYSFDGALRRDEWSLFRLSYRPYDFEKGRDARLGEPDTACPPQCACDKYTDKICMVRSAGCVMQSADAYFVHRRAMKAMVPELGKGLVIDYHVFKQMPNQFFLTPAVARQTSFSYGPDIISEEDGKTSVRVFMEKCQRDVSWTE
jgi:hypothetical protein